MNNKYYLALPTHQIHFIPSLFSVDEHDCVSSLDIPNEITQTSFFQMVTSRDTNFESRQFSGSRETFSGWSLSKAEYDRLKRMTELVGFVREFERLSQTL